jgi:hypothetical protein
VTDSERLEDRDAGAVLLTVSAPDGNDFPGGVNPTRSLRSWLVDVDELRGRVQLIESSSQPGGLGTWAEALAVILAPGGAAAVLAGAVVSWTRWNRSDLQVTLRRGNGDQAEVNVKRLRGLDAAGLPAVIDALRQWLDDDTPGEGCDTAELERSSDAVVRAVGGGGGGDDRNC